MVAGRGDVYPLTPSHGDEMTMPVRGGDGAGDSVSSPPPFNPAAGPFQLSRRRWWVLPRETQV